MCKVCGEQMNPVELLMGNTCGICTRLIHKHTVKGLSYLAAVAPARQAVKEVK